MVSRGRKAWNVGRSFCRGSEQLRSNWRVQELLSRQSDADFGEEDSRSMKRSSNWRGRETSLGGHFQMESFAGWPSLGGPKRGITGRCRQHSPRERRGRTSGPSRKQKEAWRRRFSKTGWIRRAQTRDFLKRAEIKAEVVGEARKDTEELVNSFRTVKKRRACPAGSLPAEIWTMLLHASRNLSPGGQGIGCQRKKT